MDTPVMEAAEFAATRQPLPRAATLPPRCYTDPQFYAREAEHICRYSHLEKALWQLNQFVLERVISEQ